VDAGKKKKKKKKHAAVQHSSTGPNGAKPDQDRNNNKWSAMVAAVLLCS
jgi:hypothetical protein